MIKNWDVSIEDATTITKIVERYIEIELKAGREVDPLEVNMDIIAVHNNGCELNLEGLLNADNFDFGHDVFGIIRHINRNTGELLNCFSPRYSLRRNRV